MAAKNIFQALCAIFVALALLVGCETSESGGSSQNTPAPLSTAAPAATSAAPSNNPGVQPENVPAIPYLPPQDYPYPIP